jgi:acyl transferase domain-containing protein/NADPH:quinone reductase-like Zn-dependent oxidoreductase/ubiquinone/menaquinone biosynthesis C-methylase UbiE/acyl carrier protein
MERIAIIGLGCRFSGGATDAASLWDVLLKGESTWSEIPESRFDKDKIFHPNPEKRGLSNVRGGHFLDQDLAVFDAPFFNLSEKVASSMDPQYRMELEVVYEAIENAGLSLQDLQGSKTAVFAGACFRDYHDSLIRDPETLPQSFMTGNGGAMASNRISHFFDLRGPSMTVDTGCSTTLTALHLAVQSLRTHESDFAIVSGASLAINPDMFISLSDLGVLSSEGVSYSFDHRAHGYGRGEGVAAIVIKRLPDAAKDGDPIRAVIRETAVNQDGKTATITSPSQSAQSELIKSCYQRAGLDPLNTAYVEAHGTGTQAGDLTEASALAEVFSSRSQDATLFSSVKSVIGHTEAASGLASVIKVVLALENQVIPPAARFEEENPGLHLRDWNMGVPTTPKPWPRRNAPLRASINNFGYGGSNAHVIIEAFDTCVENGQARNNGESNGAHINGTTASNNKANGLHADDPGIMVSTPLTNGNSQIHLVESNGGPTQNGKFQSKELVFILSAKDNLAMETRKQQLQHYIATHPLAGTDRLLPNLAYTLSSRRTKFKRCVAYTAESTQALGSALEKDDAPPTSFTDSPRIGFVFTGQGAQWAGMGHHLIQEYPVFHQTLLRAEACIQSLGSEWSLMEELLLDAHTSRINDMAFSLPICAAVQLALVELLRSWGIKPTAVTGHSSGEIAAAYTVGGLSFEAVMAVAYLRGAMSSKLDVFARAKGGMLAVGTGRQSAEHYIQKCASGMAVVACVNSQASVTISGDIQALEEIELMLKRDNIFARRLKVSAAFHSPHMAPVSEAYADILDRVLQPGEPTDIAFSSSLTGKVLGCHSELSKPEYWVGNMLGTVEFEDSFSNLCLNKTSQQQVDYIIEIGPHGALAGPIQQIMTLPRLENLQIPYGSCLTRGKNEAKTMRALACDLIRHGCPVDVGAINAPIISPDTRVLYDLPTYPWTHQRRYWAEPRVSRDLRFRLHRHHDLLGARLPGSNHLVPTWRHIIRASELPWVREHRVQSQAIYPGAGLICMALEGFRQICSEKNQNMTAYKLKNVEISNALAIDEDNEVEVQMTILPSNSHILGSHGWHDFRVFSYAPKRSQWIEHCHGSIMGQSGISPDLSAMAHSTTGNPNSGKKIDPSELFVSLRKNDIFHGPVFQNIRSIQARNDTTDIFFQVANSAATMPYNYEQDHIIHPTTLDSVFLAAYSAAMFKNTRTLESAYVPLSIGQLVISDSICSRPSHLFHAQSTVHQLEPQALTASVSVYDSNIPVVQLSNLTCQSIGNHASSSLSNGDSMRGFVVWNKDISLNNPRDLGHGLKFSVDTDEACQLKDLKSACLYYMNQALSSLSESEMDDLEPHLRKYVSWMQRQLKQHSHESLDSLEPGLLSRVAAATVNGQMVTRLGSHLAPILRRETTALELMRQGDLLTEFYKNALKINRSYWQAAEMIKLCTHKNPRAQVLEIGAGTGSGTRTFFNAISNEEDDSSNAPFEHYTFTDISAGFFESAKERFRKWEQMMSFRKLDIEVDPEEQSFTPGFYDIVIAAQCLHATANMKRTLGHVRKLLKPGGKLILVETTQDHMDLFFSFGLLSGWWLGEEDDRKLTPNLTKPSWGRVLKDTGFTGVDVEVQDCESEELYMISTMMATANPEQPIPTSKHIRFVTLNTIPPDSWLAAVNEAVSSDLGIVPEVLTLDQMDNADSFCVVLDQADAILSQATTEQFQRLRDMLRQSRGTLWISRGGVMESHLPHASLQVGLLRTLRTETGGGLYASLDLDATRPLWCSDTTEVLVKVLGAVLDTRPGHTLRDFEFAERQGVVYIPRIFAAGETSGLQQTERPQWEPFTAMDPSLNLQIETPGMLDSLVFRQNPARSDKLAVDEVEIDPKAFGVNFRDIMVAMGQLQTNKFMGFECAGTIVQLGEEAASNGFRIGDRVCCLLRGQYTSRPRTPWKLVAHIPDSMEYETAAAVPLAYSTAYGSLYDTARLARGERVLIHAAAGGVGQAAILFSQHIGAEIFATAGTEAKRRLLSTQFGIPDDHIYSSRDSSFVQHIHRLTDGKGVDVVVNSLAGNLLQESFNCMSQFGRFVEIGKRDLEQDSHLGMFPFTRNVSFMSYDLTIWVELRPDDVCRGLNKSIDMLTRLERKPMSPIVTYPVSSIETAFRTMQTGQHSGKLVITISPEDSVKVKRPLPKTTLSEDVSYLIVGGMTGVGRSLCKWLLTRGAKNIAIVSRKAKKDSYFLDLERAFDSHIVCLACDVSQEDELRKARETLSDALPPIKGIIQGAMVLKDTIIERMSFPDFQAATLPKVNGSWNLHNIFHDLDFFVMLSSSTGIIGNGGQGNYASGGTFQDAFCHYRRAKGLSASTIDLGRVQSVGWVAETCETTDNISNAGISSLDEEEVHELVDRCISTPSLPGQIVTGLRTGPGPHWETQAWTKDGRFSPLRYRHAISQQNGDAMLATRSTMSIFESLARQNLTANEQRVMLTEAVTAKLSKMFLVAENELLPSHQLSDIGVDSLVAVELRNWLTSQLSINASIFDLMNNSTLEELTNFIAAKWEETCQTAKGGS